MWPGSGYEDWFLVEDAVFEHAVDHVASAAREADDGGVVALALFAFALVVGDGRRVFGGRDERGLPQRVLEAFVAPSGGSLALDAGAGLAGGRSDAGVGGQVGRAFEVGDVAADEIEVFHTDRGGEFTGERIERMLDVFGITRSLSRPGNPYDNAVVESTNRLVKKELIHRNVYTNVEQLRSDVNRYVWWYNHQRLHSTLGYLSPVEFTQQGKTL